MEKEIEVKVKIENISGLKKKLEEKGVVWGKPRIQVDKYYRLKKLLHEVQKPGSYIIRIREEEKAFLTLKGLTERYGVWDELETEISKPDQLEKILERIGYVNVVTLHKRRTSGKYGKFSLEIDEIKELGDYLEAEAIGTEGERLQKEITEFFISLDLNKSNIERRGYPEIVLQDQGERYEGQI